jgi:two-component system cell cycle sensor histidine kinase/response regulator CckA
VVNTAKLSIEGLWMKDQPGPFAVLAVSPNRTAVAFLEKMMRPLAGRTKVEVTQARSVSEAINELDLGPFHLCLFDVDLGEAALLRWLKTTQAHENRLATVILTSPDQEELTARGLLEGARDYLFKTSLDPELLLRSMHYSLEKEKAEQSLKRATRLSRRFFAQSPVGTFRLSADGVLLDCNTTFAQTLGYDNTEQALAEGGLTLYYSDQTNQHQLDWLLGLTVLADNRVCLRRADGTPVWVQMRIWTAEGLDGQQDQVEGALSDLTSMEALRDELHSSQAELGTLVELMDEGALFVDPMGRIQGCNRAVEKLLDIEASDLLGHLITEAPLQARPFVAAPDQVRLLSLEEIRPGHDLRAKVVVSRGDGQERVMNLRAMAVPRPASGETSRIIVILGEEGGTTEVDGERHEDRLSSMGRMAGGVVHDFNNLLTTILGYNDMLLLEMEESDRKRRHVTEARKATVRAKALAEELLGVGRDQGIEVGVLEVNEVVREMQGSLEGLLGGAITLVVDRCRHGLPVRMDRDAMQRVITNLVLNAKDALPGGGRIIVATERIDVADLEESPTERMAPGWYALLKIRDTGIGMDEATRSKIFEPFFTTKGERQGTGLGLSTVRDIVRRARGWISVVSAPNRGTTVRVWLPMV